MSVATDKGRRGRRVSLTLDAETAERLDRIAELDRRWDAHSIGALLRPLLAEALRCYERERERERGKTATSRRRRNHGSLLLVPPQDA